MSTTGDLRDIIFCEDHLSYSTIRNYYVVPESYEEAYDQLMGCYVATFRFQETYKESTRYVWINKDADTPFLVHRFGKNKHFLGRVGRREYRDVKKEIGQLGGRCLVVQQDWYYQFRDQLIFDCY